MVPFAELLAGAARDGFALVQMASDRPLQLVSTSGARSQGDTLTTDQILESITPSLPTAQQAELALGEAAHWVLAHGEYRWNVEARASLDAVEVLARLDGAELPHSVSAGSAEDADHQRSAAEDDDPHAIEMPAFDADAVALDPGGFELTDDDGVDLELGDVGESGDPGAPIAIEPQSELSMEFELRRGRGPRPVDAEAWVELDDDSAGFAGEAVGATYSTQPPIDAPNSSSLVHVLARPPVADRAVRDSAVPATAEAFGLAPGLEPPAADPPASDGVPAVREFGDTPVVGSRSGESLPPAVSDVVGLELPSGALCFLPARHVAEMLRRLGSTSLSVGDGSHLGRRAAEEDVPDLRRLSDQPDGGCLVVRDEDPSRWLGFCLRRLEEGFRVLVETRARTPAGARRALLGVDATSRAEAWLDVHDVFWLDVDDRGWRLRRVSADTALASETGRRQASRG